MSCPHLKKDGSYYMCKKTNQRLTNDQLRNTCQTSKAYYECTYYKRSSGGCFITTAVCDSFGKEDDCHELTLLRAFRDNWLAHQDGGNEAIVYYYEVAPKIVRLIDRLEEKRDEIYQNIYDMYLAPCVSFIESENYSGCYKVYSNMVDKLVKDYLS